MIRRTSVAALAAGFILTVALPARAQEVVLRLKFRVGEWQKYRLDNKNIVNFGEMKIVQEMSQYWTQKVLKVEGEEATVEMTFTRITGKIPNPMSGEETVFDSDKDDLSANPMGQAFAALIGKKLTMKISTRGKVTELKGLDDLGMGMMGGMGMEKMMDQANPHFPEEAVKVGSEWKDESTTSNPMVGDLITKMKNTIEALEGDVAKVKVEGTMESKEPEKKPEEGGEKGEEGGEDEMMKVKISGGKVTGSFEFDHARGLMVKRGSKTSMNVNRMGMEIPIDSEQTIELVKVGTGEEPKEEGKK